MSERLPGLRKAPWWRAAAILVALAVAVGLWRGAGESAPEAPAAGARLTVAEAMSGDAAQFSRALAPRPFRFPEDHGPHRDFRTEWWYFTGNLETADGRPFGFQLTFFRFALAATAPPRASAWATNQVYMGHLALTDGAAARHYPFERFSREAVGLAGAVAEPFRVWLEDWVAAGRTDDGGGLHLDLAAVAEGTGIRLRLTPEKPLVLQGDAGLSQKSAEPGNASYYYSFTRMAAAGEVRVAGVTHAVRGSAWMDREWSTSALGPEQAGWDWFALQLGDGRDLMYYQLREQGGGVDPHSKGVLVAADGSSRLLRPTDLDLQVLEHWTSPRSGARYPSRWRLRLPAEDLELEVRPLVPDQEMDLTVRYWEGAVRISGSAAGQPVDGRGYVELTGY